MAAPTFSSFPSFPPQSHANASGSTEEDRKDVKASRSKHRPDRSRSRERSYWRDEDSRVERERHQRRRSGSRERERSSRHRAVEVYDDERDKARLDREEKRKRQRQEAHDLATSSRRGVSRTATAPERDDLSPSGWHDPEQLPKVFSDVAPDRLRFTAEHSLDPPSYRRRLASVIGLASAYRVEHSRDRSRKGVELNYRDHLTSSSRVRLPLEAPPTKIRRLAIPASTPDELNITTPFVRFDARAGRQTRRIEEAISDEEFEQEFADLPPSDAERRERVMALEQRVRDDPGDVQRWLKYASQHVHPGSYGDPLDAPMDKASAEVAISILNKALLANPTSSVLHLTLIRVMEQISKPEEVSARWAATLRHFPLEQTSSFGEAFAVRMAHLGWSETGGFGSLGLDPVERVVKLYQGMLDMLRAIVLNVSRQSEHRLQYESALLYLFHRLALFLRHAGYEERGLAMFQGLMEVTFFKPQDLIAPASHLTSWWNALLLRFEQFWNGETPRFGEVGSAGWRSGPQMRSSSRSAGASAIPADFTEWYGSETASPNHDSPASIMEGDDDDPHKIILFDDIRPLLVPLLHPEVRLSAVFCLLNFLGLTYTAPDMPTDSPQTFDPFMQWAVDIRSIIPDDTTEQQYPWRDGEPTSTKPRVFRSPVKSWMFDVDTLFAQPSEWFTFIDAHQSTVDISHVRRCMAQLQPLIPDPRFGMLMISVEAAFSMKSAANRAKSMLSADRGNLNLWNAYASLEIGRHRYDAARTVFANALSFSQAERGASVVSEDELDLLAAWVQMESDSGQFARAVDLLVHAAAGEAVDYVLRAKADYLPTAPSTMQFLRARQHFSTPTLDTSQARLRLSFFFHKLVQEDIPAAVTILRSAASELNDDGEVIYQFLVKQLHMDRSKIAQRELGPVLDSAVDRYPHNTIFQSLRLASTLMRSARAAERLVEDISTAEHTSVVQMLWCVGAMAEVAGAALWKSDGSGAVRLRALLSRLVQTSKGRQSALVWQAYITFEGRMGNPGVKQLCYRAVTSLASCKAFYLLPFSLELRRHFSKQEHRDWLLLMVERGVRIKTPFEHLLEADEEAGLFLDQLPGDEVPEEDELAFLQQREELKPYA